jgi:hypothetical protein
MMRGESLEVLLSLDQLQTNGLPEIRTYAWHCTTPF